MPGVTEHRENEDRRDQKRRVPSAGATSAMLRSWGFIECSYSGEWINEICIFEGSFSLLSLKSLIDMLRTDLASPFAFCRCSI